MIDARHLNWDEKVNVQMIISNSTIRKNPPVSAQITRNTNSYACTVKKLRDWIRDIQVGCLSDKIFSMLYSEIQASNDVIDCLHHLPVTQKVQGNISTIGITSWRRSSLNYQSMNSKNAVQIHWQNIYIITLFSEAVMRAGRKPGHMGHILHQVIGHWIGPKFYENDFSVNCISSS